MIFVYFSFRVCSKQQDYLSDAGTKKEVNPQYDLFSTLINRTGSEDELSNLLNKWDLIPRNSLNRQSQARIRTKEGTLPIRSKNFISLAGEPCSIEITPAKIYVKGDLKEYYPAETEELIEEILRNLFIKQPYGSHVKEQRGGSSSWCKFTLGIIQFELKKQGRVRSLTEIKEALAIMHKCNIQVTVNDKQTYSGPILPEMAIATRAEYISNSSTLSAVKFSSVVSDAIDNLEYRQFNYDKMVSLDSQLSRWVFKYLSVKFLNAGRDAAPFKLKYSDVDQNSGLIHYKEPRKRIQSLRKVVEELEKKGVIDSFSSTPILEARKRVDMIFELTPSFNFFRDMVAANSRNKTIRAISSQTAPIKKPPRRVALV